MSVDSLRVVEEDAAAEIALGDEPLLRIFDADAALEQVGRAELARAPTWSRCIRRSSAIAPPARATRGYGPASPRWSRPSSSALGIGLILWLWRRLDVLMIAPHGTARPHRRHPVVRGGARRPDPRGAEERRHSDSGRSSSSPASWSTSATCSRCGPSTRGLSRDIVGFALSPLDADRQRHRRRTCPASSSWLVLFFVIRLVLRLVRLFFETVGRGTVTLANFDADWAEPTYKIARIAIVAFGLIVAYPYIPGSESDAFKGVSLFIGIVFSLGSSSAISNIIAGYMMTYRRAFKVGDRVKIGDAMGDVIEMRLQVTHLKTFKNEEIVIPNSQILAGDVVNYSSFVKTQGLILHTEVGIGYETPWRQVEAMLLEAAGRCRLPSGEPPRAFVLLKKLGDFAVTYEINVYCTDIKAMLPLYTALHRHILDVFNEYGVQIMTPAYEGDPEQPKVVPPKDWFTAPAVAPPGTAAP